MPTLVAITLPGGASAAVAAAGPSAAPEGAGRIAPPRVDGVSTGSVAAWRAVERHVDGRNGSILFATNYDALTDPVSLTTVWQAEQEPADIAGNPYRDRIRVVRAPGRRSDPRRPTGRAVRVELRPYDDPGHPGPADGDVTDRAGHAANRAELYDRLAPRARPPQSWPDPVGATRWYSFSVFLPDGFVADQHKWLDFVQWKGLDTGMPPIALEIAGNRFVLGGAHARRPLARLRRGRWTRFIAGIKFSPDRREGWVSVQVNGRNVLPKSHLATMNTRALGALRVVDPTYLKQGIYRSAMWTVTHVLYFGPTVVATTRRAALR